MTDIRTSTAPDEIDRAIEDIAVLSQFLGTATDLLSRARRTGIPTVLRSTTDFVRDESLRLARRLDDLDIFASRAVTEAERDADGDNGETGKVLNLREPTRVTDHAAELASRLTGIERA